MKKKKLSLWPTYSLLAVFIFPLALVGYTYFTTDFSERVAEEALAPAVSLSAPLPVSRAAAELRNATRFTATDAWETIYPNTEPMTIATVAVRASMAKTWPERIRGLSGTPYLPKDVVKVFLFDTDAFHSIWMKDMLYAIDILWVDAQNNIVHIEENALPESYPKSFVPQVAARTVIETVAGFVDEHGITVGDTVVLPR